MEIETNIAEENAFTQPILHLSLTNIQRAHQSLEFKGTGTLRYQKAWSKWGSLCHVSKLPSFLLLQHSTCSVLWVSESVLVFRGKGNLLIELQKNCKKYPRSSHPMLICTLNFRYILMEEVSQIKDGSIHLAATAWSFISMTTLALPLDKALSCGTEQKRKNLTAWPPILHRWPWADSSPSLSLRTGRVILYSVTLSTVKEPTDSVCVEGKCELKGNVLQSLRSTVGKQTPPEVGPRVSQ